MAEPRAQALSRLLEVVAELLTARDPRAFGAIAVRGLGQLVASDVCGYTEMSLTGGGAWAITSATDYDTPERVEVFARLMHAHPVIAAHRGSGDSSPAAISDLLTRRAWHANPLWVEAFAELEVEDQLSTGLIADGARLIGLSINRSRRGFSAADRAILDLARPAIAAALDVVATRERDGALIAQLAAVTEADGLGVAVVDEQGRVLEASPGALALLAAWLDATDHVALDRSLTDLRRRADRRLRIRTRPHPTRPGHTIVILREELEDLTATGIRLGLRPREAEAIALAAEGLTNAQIAARMGITPNTVRTHLERVHETLGVARRMAAVARLRAAALEQAR